jgi:hypothetical protein
MFLVGIAVGMLMVVLLLPQKRRMQPGRNNQI